MRALVLGMVLALVAAPRIATAEMPRTVVLAMDPDDPVLEATIRELLGRLGLSLVRRANGPVLAQVSVVGAHLAVRAGDRTTERDVGKDATTAVTREEIALAVRSAVEAELLAAETPQPVATPQVPPPEPQPVTPPPPPSPVATMAAPPPDVDRLPPPARSNDRSVALELATFFAAGPIAAGSGFVPRIGGAAGIASTRGVRPSITLRGAYALPFDSDASVVTARSSFVALRLMPGLELYRSDVLALGAEVGGGVDIVTVSPRSDTLPDAALGRSSTRADVLASGFVTGRVALVSSVVLLAAVGADADLVTRSYVTRQGATDAEVFAPWRLHPTLLVGIAFTAFGPATFASAR